MRKLTVAQSAGFCFGVSRAVEMARQAEKPLYCVGDIVHNRFVVEDLRTRGMESVSSLAEVPEGGAVLLRSHGTSREMRAALGERRIVDATCPCVESIHNIVRRERGAHVLIFGNPSHPEVQATASWCESCTVFESLSELTKLCEINRDWLEKSLVAVAQTTASEEDWTACTKFLKKVYTNLKILDTICKATRMRQSEAESLSRKAELMIVVGDRHSSNTKNLAAVCQRVIQIQSARELDVSVLGQYDHIGVTAGASTPAEIIEEVVYKMTEEMKKAEQAAAAEGSESFADLLEASLKTLTSGDLVTGIITGITTAEIQVDLGTKHAGYIPVDELSDDPSDKFVETLKVGDEIETFVVRVNDVEGTAMLSRKRLETVKTWETVEEAKDNQAILDGIVIEENKGGIVVSVKGVRVFVPASQSGLAKDVPMSSIMKQKVKLRITEFNRARRRVVGSIRSVQQELRRAASEGLLESIAVGNVYQGTVKSLTSFGAFVDIGGMDGMVHVSELSWKRISQPSDILKVGDPLEVYVLSFDKEKKKISLGHRKAEDNPWNKFLATYNVGDVFGVKVIKLMPFGAFCEVLPGVDGLIHISQLADHRVVKPSDVVSEGDFVRVKLTEVDLERKKMSLSIRALMEDEAPAADAADDFADEIVATSEEGKTAVAGDYIESAEMESIMEAVAEAVTEVAAEEAAE